eukprot:1136777-Pelagomonas_calceolata.AAC.4
MLQEQAKYKQVSRNSTIAPGFLSVASHEPSAPVHSTTCSTKSKCCLGQTERHSTALDFLCCAPVQHRHGQHDLDSREVSSTTQYPDNTPDTTPDTTQYPVQQSILKHVYSGADKARGPTPLASLSAGQPNRQLDLELMEHQPSIVHVQACLLEPVPWKGRGPRPLAALSAGADGAPTGAGVEGSA